jgi:hypothetical protein
MSKAFGSGWLGWLSIHPSSFCVCSPFQSGEQMIHADDFESTVVRRLSGYSNKNRKKTRYKIPRASLRVECDGLQIVTGVLILQTKLFVKTLNFRKLTRSFFPRLPIADHQSYRFLVLSGKIISMDVAHGVKNIITNPLIFSIKRV